MDVQFLDNDLHIAVPNGHVAFAAVYAVNMVIVGNGIIGWTHHRGESNGETAMHTCHPRCEYRLDVRQVLIRPRCGNDSLANLGGHFVALIEPIGCGHLSGQSHEESHG